MKHLFKSIIAAMLIAVMAVTAFGTETTHAASKPVIKVTYNKKAVNLTVTDTGVKEVRYDTLEKKWGKADSASKVNYMDTHAEYYSWENDGTRITYATKGEGESGPEHYYSIEINEKNGAVCGVKNGMSVKKAKKLFKKALKNTNATIELMDNDHIIVKLNTEPWDCISYIDCTVEDGKVAYIYVGLYH